MQMQTIPRFTLEPGPGQKPPDSDAIPFLQLIAQCYQGLAGQYHAYSGLDFPCCAILPLPGAVLKPEFSGGHPGGGQTRPFKCVYRAGQFAVIALCLAQLATSSFSFDLASDEASVTASSRRITMLRITASLKRKVFSSSASVSPSHSTFIST